MSTHAELTAHTEWLHRLARALVGDASADDVAQDVIVAAIAKPPQEPGPLKPWLAGVARNLAKMSRRGGARRERREHAFDALHAEAPPTPEELVARASAQQQVARVVLELAEPWRSTVLLRYFEGLSAAEIASAQGVPAATVRGRLKDALERIRVAMDREHAGERRRWIALIAPLPSLPLAASPPTAAAVAGGLLVKKVLVGMIVVALIVVGTRLAGLWGGGSDDQAAVVAAAGSAGGSSAIGKPVAPVTTATAAPPGGRSQDAIFDNDPRGTLRLEGQVIDDKDAPVAKALVAIDANPPILVESEDDGSFVFEGLIARDYRVEATKGEQYADPVRLRMTSKPEPITLRMRRGGVVEVTVTERPGGRPIANAEVELRSALTWKATTNADGIAKLGGIGATWSPLAVRAAGFAPSAVMVGTSGNPAAPTKVSVALAKGAPIAGRVVDEAGKPVSDARVVAASASDPFPVIDARRDGVLTGKDGTFTLPAVSVGTWRLTATHAEYAPGNSAPLTVDGVAAKSGVQIVVAGGATVRGIVKDPQGQPVAAADVRVVVRGHVEWRARRQALTAADGTFAMTGLPRRAVDVVGWHESAGASAIAAVDLVTAREAKVDLVLDIGGAIAGTVVDRGGAAVGDAQVIAEPEWTGGVEDRAAWSVRGIQETITDQAGAFRFVGMPAGTYRIRAARSGTPETALSLSPSTIAKPGDTGVRLVVPADAKLVGKVAFSDGTSPPLFAVSIHGTDPVPFASKDGTFALTVPAGEHSLSITGPSFTETRVAKVAIVEGKETDAGTITVTRGRSISGRVLDENGTPIEGARVAGGKLLTGGGSELYIESESIGAKATTTDAAGHFSLDGFGPISLALLAGKDGIGRSASLRVPPGEDSVTVDLVLQPTAGIDGKITKSGAPLADTVIIANPFGATASNFFTTTGPDGTFALDALAPGSYVLYPMLGGGGGRPKDMYVRRIEIVLGKRTKVEIDATPGSIALEVAVETDAGAAVPMAQIVAMGLHIDPKSVDELRDGSAIPDALADEVIPTYIRQAMGGTTTIEGMRPGKHTICAVPIVLPVDESKLKQKCGHITLAAATPKAKLAIVIPAAWLEPPPKSAGSATP